MRNRTRAIMWNLLFVFGLLSIGFGQEQNANPADAKAEVPELSEFHEVIYPLWHTAWPEKNITMLVGLLPDIDQRSAHVIHAKLPGILREKQTAWNKGVKELELIVHDYQSAVSPVDSQKLLHAAERLHSQYEKLVRIVRPALKEIDAFHSLLYQLYHYYLPEWNLEKIKSSAAELSARMDFLNKAELPKRLESKREAFLLARKNLEASVKTLNKTIAGGDKQLITEKINSMHEQYQALDNVFN